MDRSALSRATDSTSAPTPGYLYNDIAKTLTSPQVCTDTVSYLLTRLSKNNPHIKKKALKVLSKIVIHPTSRGMMKRSVVHNPAAIPAIKDAIAYRGSMDAVNGDTFNNEVRECAKECLEIVYSDAGEVTTTMGNSTNAAFANTAVGGGGYGNTSSSSSNGVGESGYGAPMGGVPGTMSSPKAAGGMQGIGNPMFADPRLTQQSSTDGSTVGGLLGMATQIGGAMVEMIKDPLAKNVPPLPSGGYNPRPDPYASRPPGANNLAHETGGQWTMASNRGLNAYNNNNYSGGGSGDGGGTTSSNNNSHNESEYYKARNAQGTGQALSWAHAATTHGVGSTPSSAPPSTTTPFTSSSGGVGGSCAMAVPSQPPQSVASMARQPSVASALPVTNSYVGGGGGYAPSGIAGATGGGGGGGEYERNLIRELCPPGGMKAEPPQDKLYEFAHSIPSLNPDIICPALLDALEEGNPWIMRAKALCVIETVLRVEADRVMAVGGGKTPYTDFFHACSAEIEPLAEHARANVKAPAKRVLLALGMDETSIMNGSSSVANHHTTEVDQTPVALPPNLLDFDEPITASEETPASAIATAPALPPPTIDGGAGGNSLFSGLNTKASHVRNVSAPVVTSTVPAAIPLSSAQDDLLGGFGAEEASVPASSSFNDMFGSMTVKGDTTTEATNGSTASPANAALGAQSGSSFGFINATPATSISPTTIPAAFDPLLSLGISAPPMSNVIMNNIITANTTFNAPNPNIAQMQLAYQQNMLMMQQMQLQQQQVGSGALRGGMSGTPMMVVSPQQPTNKIMGANYMRQVPGVSGDNMSSFSFLSQPPAHKKENKSFDFVMDAMKSEKK